MWSRSSSTPRVRAGQLTAARAGQLTAARAGQQQRTCAIPLRSLHLFDL